MSISPLSDAAYEHLLALIQNNDLRPHDRLPGEVAMAEHCGVSRPVVRQALARARAEGRVYAKHGIGNRFFVLTMAALEEQTRFAIQQIGALSPQPQQARWRDIHDEHRRIDTAIAAGDPDAARLAMSDHLRGSLARLFGREL